MRSWAPFCSGCPGTIRSTLMPSRIHQSDSRESRARPGEPKGLPLSDRIASGWQAKLTEHLLKGALGVLVLGRGKGDAGEQKAADVIDDGERIAVLVVAEQEFALVVDRHQIVWAVTTARARSGWVGGSGMPEKPESVVI